MKRKILSLALSYVVLMGMSLIYNDYKMREQNIRAVDERYRVCIKCGGYATDKEENFNNDGVCIVCLNPSLLEE